MRLSEGAVKAFWKHRGKSLAAASCVVVGVIGIAWAAQDEAEAPEGEATEEEAPEKDDCGDPLAGVEKIMAELELREARLDLREQSLDARLSDLKNAEDTIRERLAEVSRVRDEAEAFLDGLEEDEAARVKGLAKRMEAMKPKVAAEMFTQLFTDEPETAIDVLASMSNSKSGKMMSAIEPAVAAKVGAAAVAPLDLGAP